MCVCVCVCVCKLLVCGYVCVFGSYSILCLSFQLQLHAPITDSAATMDAASLLVGSVMEMMTAEIILMKMLL